MKVNYKELTYFKKSHEFTLEIYKITKEFPKEEKFGLTSQIRRAASSVPANISEGSAKSQADFKRFLSISLGSAKECEYWLLLAKDLEYISISTYDRLIDLLDRIIGSLVNYIKKM
jgi:four helix bundle protein